MLSREEKEISKTYEFTQENYWLKTVGQILTEKGYQKLDKENVEDKKFPTAGYESFYSVYKGTGSLSIPGVTITSHSILDTEIRIIENWCNDQWDSKNFKDLLAVAKWCTKRISISSKLPPEKINGSENHKFKLKENTSDFSRQNYFDFLREKGLSKEEKDWMKDLSGVTGINNDAADKNIAKLVDWCTAATGYTYIDERDTDEYKRTVKYCVKKEYLSELDS